MGLDDQLKAVLAFPTCARGAEVGKARTPVGLDDQLKAVLACPFCKGALEFHEEWGEAWCRRCRLAWPIQNGVPDLVLGSSRPLKP